MLCNECVEMEARHYGYCVDCYADLEKMDLEDLVEKLLSS